MGKTKLSKAKKILLAIFIPIVAIILAFAIFVGYALMTADTRECRTLVNRLFHAQFEGDAEDIVALIPKEVFIGWEEWYEDSNYTNEYKDVINERIADFADEREEETNGNWYVHYEILSMKDASEEKLNSIREEYENEEIKIDITEVKIIEIEYLIDSRAMEEEEIFTEIITAIKVRGHWYLDIYNTDSFIGLYY